MAPETMITTLNDLLQAHNLRGLRALLADMNAVDVAQFVESLPRESATVAFRTLPKEEAVEVFAQLDADCQQHIVATVTDQEIAAIMEELMVDDAVDMLEEMPAGLVKRVLRNASPETRGRINQFLRYPEDSAGSIMTAEFTDLKKAMLVAEAIKRIRRIGQDRETIYTCYVVDQTRRLQGVVTVKDLLLAQDGDCVADLMQPDVISVATATGQEETAKLMAKYGLISLPVVDAENRLVGIVTVDDAVDVLREEDTEDFEMMAAMTPSERPYLKTGVMRLAANRLPWLLLLMVSGMLTGLVLGLYGDISLALPVLATFIPMLTGTGGNAGSQSSTMVIRGIALGEVRTRDILRVAWKEARVGVLVGLGLAVVNWLRMLATNPNSGLIPVVVCLTLAAAVFIAKVIGGTLPIAAKACKLDPALMAAPLITSIVDAVVLVVYFSIAGLLLGY